MSFQFEGDSNVFIWQFVFFQEIPTYVTLQLAQIYGKGKDRLDIVTPHVKSQVGENDCGAFLPSQTWLNFAWVISPKTITILWTFGVIMIKTTWDPFD